MKNKVLVFGSFDYIHPGHLDFFRQAKSLGDELHVAIGLDQTIEEIKGDRPWKSQGERLQEVQNLEIVDKAYLGYADDKLKIIGEVKPDIIALGYDQKKFTEHLEDELKKRGFTMKIVRLKPHHPEKFKSSIVKKEMSSE